MTHFVVDPHHPDEKILMDSAEAIKQGKVLLIPTDTCYILAANALDQLAVEAVFSIKGRSFNNPIHIIAPDLDAGKQYAYFDDISSSIARQFLPGPLTLVLPRKDIIPNKLVNGLPTVGIRIPNNQIALQLSRLAERPITATSANLSRNPTPYSVDEAKQALGGGMADISFILDQGPLSRIPTSTLLDLTTTPPSILREGPVSSVELINFWNALIADHDVPS